MPSLRSAWSRPPSLSASIAKTVTANCITKLQRFAVNVLSQEQLAISQFCSRPREDKFIEEFVVSRCDHPDRIHMPVLQNSLITFDCSATATLVVNSHLVVMGRGLCQYSLSFRQKASPVWAGRVYAWRNARIGGGVMTYEDDPPSIAEKLYRCLQREEPRGGCAALPRRRHARGCRARQAQDRGDGDQRGPRKVSWLVPRCVLGNPLDYRRKVPRSRGRVHPGGSLQAPMGLFCPRAKRSHCAACRFSGSRKAGSDAAKTTGTRRRFRSS